MRHYLVTHHGTLLFVVVAANQQAAAKLAMQHAPSKAIRMTLTRHRVHTVPVYREAQ